MSEAQDLIFEDIDVGMTASFEAGFTAKDIKEFARLSGDLNPLHLDEEYAAETFFKKPLVHGMLVSSLCSRMVGMYIPGKRCLYISQTLQFRKPVFADDELIVEGIVTDKSLSTHLVTIRISIKHKTEEVLTGEAITRVLENK